MFPIVHYYANRFIFPQVSSLMALGGLFPDLAAGMGIQRDDAHQMGDALYQFCINQQPQAGLLRLGWNVASLADYFFQCFVTYSLQIKN